MLDEKHIVKDVRNIWDSNFERSIKFCKAPEELRILYSMALHFMALQKGMRQVSTYYGIEKCFELTTEAILYAAKLDYGL